MKFIIDAQLPYILKKWLIRKGLDAIHTLDLPKKNLSEDLDIIFLSVKDERIVISKDSDFMKYFILHRKPYKLLMITTGNIVNRNLITLFEKNFDKIQELLEKYDLIELDNTSVTIHY